MGVTVCMPLFGNPGRELEEGTAIQGKELRQLADALAERLRQEADALDKLAADGWANKVAMFDLILTHRQVATREQAEARLRAVGIDPEQMLIVEDVAEDDVD
jgi:hypothetical protein